MEQLEGIIEEIIFTNTKNGYTICDMRQGKRLVTLVGNMPYINVGETVVVSGTWTEHPNYGQQLKVDNYESKVPTKKETLEKYLGSGLIKGIGPATAKRIVDQFGNDTLRIIQFDTERLSEIKGISIEKAKLIGQAFQEKEEMRSATMFLQKLGVSTAYTAKIYKKFGSNTINEIKKNPYRMSEEDVGLPFKTADAIAYGMGVDTSSTFRIKYGTRYILSKAVMAGHSYLPVNILLEKTAKLLNIKEEAIDSSLSSLQFEESIYIESFQNEKRVYLATFNMAEMVICRKLTDLSLMNFKSEVDDIENKIKELEHKQNIIYEEKQFEAIVQAVKNAVTIITGGPGTGKTTIIKGIISIFKNEGNSIVLSAPTGRAAKRMTEATGMEAKTIHRLLETEYTGENEQQMFARNENNPIESDVIIIDEMSMVDTLLMHSLLKAIEPGSRLIMVGDVDQLPSVGAGRVLADIIESNKINTVKLDYIFRQSEKSMITLNAHRINRGEMPEYNNPDSDFFFVAKPSGVDTAKAIMKLCAERIPQKFDFCPLKDIQVLSPVRKGHSGVNQLNGLMQKQLNPSDDKKNEKVFREITFREGDRVMQIKNNYSLKWRVYDLNGKAEEGEGVFNGDLGIIMDVDNKAQILTVEYDDGKVVEYDFERLEELELAYAITVHKSQGSEFLCVVIPLFNIPPVLLNRNLLYTGVTRAKKLVVLVGSQKTLFDMVNNKREKDRFSGLKDKLIDMEQQERI